MAYSSMAIFQGIPAIYNIQSAKIHKRRTATNIMAGYFDPHPLFSLDSPTDLDTSSTSSTISIDEPIAHVSVPRPREMRKISSKRRKGSAPKKFRLISSMSAMIAGAKGKQIKQVRAEEKENATSVVSDGTFLPRLPHTSVTPTLSSLKRKRTPDLKEDDQSGDESKKKSRLSKSAPPEDDSLDASMTSSDPCTPFTSSSLVGRFTPDFKDENTVEKLNKADAPKLYEVSKSAGVRCKLCGKLCVTVAFTELHLRNMHSDTIDMDALPPPTERRPRGPRKNVAIKKGWKGWVEDELAPQSLILLDKPEVLPERTTRSGRKID